MGAVPCAIAEPDGEVQPFACQIGAIVVGKNAQVNVRVQAGELVYALQQPADRKGADNAEGQHFAQVAARETFQRAADPVERIGNDGHKGQPFVGKRKAAGQAPEQGRAEAALKPGDLMADRALTDAQFGGGAGEAEVAGARLEGAQGVEGELGAVHTGSMK